MGLSFIEWIEHPDKGFWVREGWSYEKKKWVGISKVQLAPHQKKILKRALAFDKKTGKFRYETVLYSTIKKSGKALALDTPIPTPTGWTTMGELKVGDVVFDEQGRPTTIIATTSVMYDRPTYRVEFSDGTSIIADADHQWEVHERTVYGIGDKVILTTQEMYEKGVMFERIRGARRFSIRTDAPLDLPDVDLPIDPYLFGVWLGDGTSLRCQITVGDEDVEEMASLLQGRGFPVVVRRQEGKGNTISLANGPVGSPEHKAQTFGRKIVELGVKANKHIPVLYLRASVRQRRELLQGLMDTDGCISKKGRAEFTTTSKRLAQDFKELLRSLGLKGRITEHPAKLNGKVVGTKYRIYFFPDFPAFKLRRKLERQVAKKETARSRFVRITNIEPVESVPVKCIEVSAASHLYLAGEGMIPTHNSFLAAAVGAWYAEEVGPPGTEIYVIANDLEQAEGRVMRDIKFHFQMRVEKGEKMYDAIKGEDVALTDKNTKINVYRIDLPNGTYIQALAQSYKSAAGSRHGLTLWDELWGVTSELSRRTWDEMTPIPTIPHSLRFIATYAGFENESDLLWDLYIQGVGKEEHEQGRGTPIQELQPLPCYENGRLFTYWDHEPRMPWQDEAYYESQMQSLRPAAFLRLHMNQWVTSHEAFIPIEWYDEAAKIYEAPATLWADHPMRYFPIYVAVDAGIKRDSTALVGVGYDAKRAKVGLAFHKIWTPTKQSQVDLDTTVEATLLELHSKFNIVSVVYDPTHLLQTMLRLKQKGVPTKEFVQNANLMTAASQLLYDLLKNKNFEAYQDEEYRRHLQMAVAEANSRGFRIVKSKVSRRHFIDAAVATAMAVYEAVNHGGVDISQPVVIASPFSDATAWGPEPLESAIPFELQSDD